MTMNTGPAPYAAKRRWKAADKDKEKDQDTGYAAGSRVSIFPGPIIGKLMIDLCSYEG